MAWEILLTQLLYCQQSIGKFHSMKCIPAYEGCPWLQVVLLEDQVSHNLLFFLVCSVIVSKTRSLPTVLIEHT